MKIITYPMHCAPRCGAKTRTGQPCKSPAIHGKARCRMHGGKSTGRPLIHGRFTKVRIKEEHEIRDMLKKLKTAFAELKKYKEISQ